MICIVFEKFDVIFFIIEVFCELGYEGVFLSKIIVCMCLFKGSLYYFFLGGKDEMVVEIFVYID